MLYIRIWLYPNVIKTMQFEVRSLMWTQIKLDENAVNKYRLKCCEYRKCVEVFKPIIFQWEFIIIKHQASIIIGQWVIRSYRSFEDFTSESSHSKTWIGSHTTSANYKLFSAIANYRDMHCETFKLQLIISYPTKNTFYGTKFYGRSNQLLGYLTS